LLLAKRLNNSGAGLLSTPGGRVEYDETVEAAGAREFTEECGARLFKTEMLGWRKHNRYGNHYLMFYIHATSWDGEIRNCIPDKSEDWAWFDLNDLNTSNCTEPSDIVQILIDRGYLWAKEDPFHDQGNGTNHRMSQCGPNCAA
jgi:ADP-ribose pyrophosphatase YjhB (NUDIX family)